MTRHSLKGARAATALEAEMAQPIRGRSREILGPNGAPPDLSGLRKAIERTHKRHARPKDALDPTPPLFSDLPRLIYCPRGKGHYAQPSAFGKNRSRPSGLATYCLECRRDLARLDRKNPRHLDRRLIRKTLNRLDRVLRLLDVLCGNIAGARNGGLGDPFGAGNG